MCQFRPCLVTECPLLPTPEANEDIQKAWFTCSGLHAVQAKVDNKLHVGLSVRKKGQKERESLCPTFFMGYFLFLCICIFKTKEKEKVERTSESSLIIHKILYDIETKIIQ